MRIFLYEYVTGGGTWSKPELDPCDHALLVEGLAMLRALAHDFLAIEGTKVLTLRDCRLSDLDLAGCQVIEVANEFDEQDGIEQCSRRCDWTVLIAPEWDDALAGRCQLVEASGGRLLGPNSQFVKVAADKHRTCEQLARNGIQVPAGCVITSVSEVPSRVSFPAVVKPRFGAGSIDIRYVGSESELGNWTPSAGEFRLERFCAGTPASVAALCGPNKVVPLPACRQDLGADGSFRYLGGSLPLEDTLRQRATDLALAAIRAMPSASGYVGVDLVLGDREDGSEDFVIEINPRITTSYVGLRAACTGNLASAMIHIALGNDVELSFAQDQIEFTASGGVSIRSTIV